MVWTCLGFIVDEICFDSALWEYLKQFIVNFTTIISFPFIKINSIFSIFH